MENEKKLFPEEPSEETDMPFSDGDEPLDSDAEIVEADFIPLDSLLYENDESTFDNDSSEQSSSFESFFAEYRELIAGNLVAAKKMKEAESAESDSDVQPGETVAKTDESVTKATVAKKKNISEKKKLKPTSADEGEESITLKPEEYEPLEAEEEIFCETFENKIDIDILLGEMATEENEEDAEENSQISFFPEYKPKIADGDEETDRIKEYDSENPRKIDTVFDFLELLIFTLVAVIILTTFFFKHSVVDGDSMNNTLSDGDHLIIWDAFYTPERDDIIVFEDYSTSLKKAVVKRVIGLPGETVEIKKSASGEFLVYIDGEPLKQDYAYHGIHYSSPNTGVWTLGENEIFVMGDNRYNSTDSRDYGVGPINIDSVLGKVVLRFFPFDQFRTFD